MRPGLNKFVAHIRRYRRVEEQERTMVELRGLKLLGALNAMLGVTVVNGVNAASQHTLSLSPAPHLIQC